VYIVVVARDRTDNHVDERRAALNQELAHPESKRASRKKAIDTAGAGTASSLCFLFHAEFLFFL